MSKTYFLRRVLDEVREKKGTDAIRMLDLGCGTARYVPALFAHMPTLTYVGLEPNERSFQKATELLKDDTSATLHNQLGYGEIAGVEDESFDLVVSMSVLEHVKELNPFIKMSARYAKRGAHVIHRYDLGHALYPHSLKERIHVFLGNTVPAMLPQKKFVRYVPLTEVTALMAKHLGATPYHTTFHQLLGTKELANKATEYGLTDAITEIDAWEFKYQDAIARIPLAARERIFPSVAVWGRKGA